MAKKYLKGMDAYVIVNEFVNDVADRITSIFTTQPEPSGIILERNWYCKYGCMMIGVGMLVAHYIRYSIKMSRRVSVKNIIEYIKRKNNRFSFQRLRKRNTDHFMFRVFANSMGIIAMSFQ
jgi:hypothetical protein